jgi:putative ABC transport system ATP-binding protein
MTLNIVEASQINKQVQSGNHTLSILTDINLSIAASDSLAIIGASGSGKSTLLGLLAGLDIPTSGRIILRGYDLSTMDEDGRALLRAKYVGFVFQSFQLLPSLTALENIMLPFELSNAETPKQHALQLLARVGLRERGHHYPRQLSGGEQQRVAIARAFAAQPAILFADEVTGNLDKKTGQHITELLFELNAEQKTTLVLITHDDVLANRCQRRICLDGGRIITGDV